MPANDKKRPRLMELREACKYGGFSKSMAYALLHAEKIEARKMGNKTMVDLDSIDRYHESLPKFQSRTP